MTESRIGTWGFTYETDQKMMKAVSAELLGDLEQDLKFPEFEHLATMIPRV